MTTSIAYSQSSNNTLSDFQMNKITPIESQSSIIENDVRKTPAEMETLIGDRIIKAVKKTENDVASKTKPIKALDSKAVKSSVSVKKTIVKPVKVKTVSTPKTKKKKWKYTFKGTKAELVSIISPDTAPALKVEPIEINVENTENIFENDNVETLVIAVKDKQKNNENFENQNDNQLKEPPDSELLDIEDYPARSQKEISFYSIIVPTILMAIFIFIILKLLKPLLSNLNKASEMKSQKNKKTKVADKDDMKLVEVNGKKFYIKSADGSDVNELDINNAIAEKNEKSFNIDKPVDEIEEFDKNVAYQNEIQYEATQPDIYKEYIFKED